MSFFRRWYQNGKSQTIARTLAMDFLSRIQKPHKVFQATSHRFNTDHPSSVVVSFHSRSVDSNAVLCANGTLVAVICLRKEFENYIVFHCSAPLRLASPRGDHGTSAGNHNRRDRVVCFNG